MQLTTCVNGRCEKFIGTIKSECLSKFIIFGKQHLGHLVAEFSDYYNRNRSHMCRQRRSGRSRDAATGRDRSEVLCRWTRQGL
ncbi:integrase core domain-containing protein [Planctomicrobium sp. SH661]|uniref:integrase core domain-containing protein n=1 Tax=Planctomicrobium sp. SH661 TaxID=3448124 RepID=UPI003F5C47AA